MKLKTAAKKQRQRRPPEKRRGNSARGIGDYASPAYQPEKGAPSSNITAIRESPAPDAKERDPDIMPAEPARLIVASPFDLPFFILVLVLLSFGLVMLFSASYAVSLETTGSSTSYISTQLTSAIIGLVLMIIVSLFNYRLWRKYALTLLIIAVILLIAVLFFGVVRNDAKRWLVIMDQSFQPSELAKLAVIVWFSAYISRNTAKMKTFRYGIMPFGIVMGIIGFLLYLEPHISGLIIIFAAGFIVMFLGGLSLKFFTLAGSLGVSAVAFIIFFTDYAKSRINIWQNPYLDPQGKGFQPIQSLIAIGSGGWLGLGLGNSRQKHLYMPESQNDFIFSIVVEEIGYIGALLVLILFAALIIRGFWIALHARDKFGSLIAAGITSVVALQTFLNIAVVSQLIPVTGVSLPFFSHGGSSLVILLIEMGIILAVSRQIPASDQG